MTRFVCVRVCGVLRAHRYLLVAVMGGVFKVGVRCFCMTLHPMRYGKTLINAFMFNTMFVLLCAIPVVQFCTEAFNSCVPRTHAMRSPPRGHSLALASSLCSLFS